MIRKSGFIIFVVVASLISLGVYLFAGTGVRLALIFGLEKSARAEVNIDKVSLGLAPLSMEVHRLQITDRNQPEFNVVSFDTAKATLELWPALMGYYVIDDMSIEGLAYQSKRSEKGEVFSREDSASEDGEDKSLGDKLKSKVPTADEVMAKVDLKTIEKGQNLKTVAKQERQSLADLKGKLPSKERLEEIKSKIEALSSQKITDAKDLAQKTEELKQLKDELEAEREKLIQAKDTLSNSRDRLQNATKELRDAANTDWQKIEQVANIKDGGLTGIAQMFLGDVWAKRIDQLQTAYRLIKPYIPKSSDDDAGQSEPEVPNRILPLPGKPYPSFWVKQANIDWIVRDASVALYFKNITAEHNVIGEPTSFQANAENMPDLNSLDVNGSFSIDEKFKSETTWSAQGIKLDPQTFGGGSQLTLESGLANISGQINLVNNKIQQQAALTLNQSSFKGDNSSAMQKLAEILNDQTQLSANITTTGTLSSPSVSVRSPLDKVIGDAILGEAKQKAKKLQQELRTDLDQKLKEQLSGNEELTQALTSQGTEIDQLDDIIEEAMKAKLKSVEDEAKSKAKDKIKDKLGDKLPNFGR